MGIRFLCEHCKHRLNVKVHQAGQRGTCPSCHGLVIVPLKSTIKPTKKKPSASTSHSTSNNNSISSEKEPSSTAESGKASLTKSGFGSTENFEFGSVETRNLEQFDLGAGPAAIDQATDEFDNEDTSAGHQRFRIDDPHDPRGPVFQSRPSNKSASPAPDEVVPAMTKSADPFMLAKPENRSLEPDAPDPVEEDPDKVWYVRHPKNGETGPVKGKTIRRMLEAAEIDSTCVVWREDWEDWEKAHLIFRELTDPDAEAGVAANSKNSLPFGSFDRLWSFLSQQRKLIQVVAGIVAGFAIIAVLIYIFIRIISN